MTTVRTVIRDRRIEVPAPEDLPDGTEVILSIGTDVTNDDGPMSPEEIARILAAMGRMQPLEIAPQIDTAGKPFYAKLRAEADSTLLQLGVGKLYLGFHLDPVYGAHWNNLVPPLKYTLDLPDAGTVARPEGESPKAG